MKSLRTLLPLMFLSLLSPAWGQTYWLKNVVSLETLGMPKKLFADTPETGDDAAFITIDKDVLIVNQHVCHAKITNRDGRVNFNRFIWDEIDAMGGHEKFRAFIRKNLKSDPNDWRETFTTEYIKQPDRGTPPGECQLFDGTGDIYVGKNEIIVPAASDLYRYVKGQPYQFLFTKEQAEARRTEGAKRTREMEERILGKPTSTHQK